jgi:hypothetical protein
MRIVNEAVGVSEDVFIIAKNIKRKLVKYIPYCQINSHYLYIYF